ncbi:MAG: insulinase family protein [Thermoflexales bacterium]|nr:insulinase family protein [Thermoflexales bacterium]
MAVRRTAARPYRVRHDRVTGVTRATLANGLTILAREMRAAPVTAFCVWYRVGSRNEHGGITGISHWVEHMMFKGTRRLGEAEMDRVISREGGYRNAFTWIDCTAYYEALPSDKIDLAIDLEADRMRGSLFKPADVESERTVIINERQGSENSPGFRLGEEVQAAAFRVHPYGHEVIGHMADLRSMTREDLYAHYQRYYTPGNAIISVAGDFDRREMIERIARRFGTIKAGPKPPRVSVEEPAQKGERRITVEGEGKTDYVTLAFHAPAATHPDALPLVVVDAVLSGAGGLTFFGGGTSSRSCRLSRALVDSGLAADAGCSLVPTVDPFLFSFYATPQVGVASSEVEAALWREIERMQNEPISAAELEKAIKQTRAQVAFNTESCANQAFWLGFSEILADTRWFTGYLDRLQAVTIEDVQRVARAYLTRSNVTVGVYVADEK